MSLAKLSLGGNNDVIFKLFPPRESLLSDIPAGVGNIEKKILRCILYLINSMYVQYMLVKIKHLSYMVRDGIWNGWLS